MSKQELSRLQDRVKIFYAEKNWSGCQGFNLTEEMKVTIAGQACLMLLGVEDYYFDNVPTVLVYPKAFQRNFSDGTSDGVSQHRSGEAWQGGPIILSWRDALRGGRNEDDGSNVVIHEFAHALDGIDGEMGGNLMFDTRDLTAEWKTLVDREFSTLVEAKKERRRTLLDHYGATNRAEFFAVASETFFEQPHRLANEHQELFSLLKKYYRLDPSPWVDR